MTSQNRSNRHAMRTSYGAHRMTTHTIATLTLPQPPSVMTCICRQSPTLCPVVYNGTEIQLRCRRCRAITLAKEHGKKVSNHHAHSLGCPRGVPSFAGKTHADKYRADAAKKPKKPSSLAVLKKDSARHAAVMGETQAAAQARLFGHPAAARALPPRPPLPAAVAAASSSSSSAAASASAASVSTLSTVKLICDEPRFKANLKEFASRLPKVEKGTGALKAPSDLFLNRRDMIPFLGYNNDIDMSSKTRPDVVTHA